MLRFLKRLIFACVFLYIGSFALLWMARAQFIYPFNPTYISPTDAGEPRLQEYSLTTKDGETLVVWKRAAQGRKATFVYFHGNAGNLAGRATRFNRLIGRGYGVVALGYRGSSGSTGKPSEEAITQDALELRRALPDILGDSPKGKIIYYGESLGTGIATKLAASMPPDALILEAPYTSVVSLAAKHMPYYPIHRVLDERWETDTYIPQVKNPTLVLHGTHDTVIPYEHGETVFDLSGARNKRFVSIQNGHHLSGFSIEGQKAIYRFIEGL